MAGSSRRTLPRAWCAVLVPALGLLGCATSPLPGTAGIASSRAATPGVSASASGPSPTFPAPGATTGTPTPALTPTAPAASATPAPSSAALRTVTVALSGDLLWHNSLWAVAARDRARTGKPGEFDFDPMFAAVKPIVAGADLAVCHSEVPFAPPGGPYTGYPLFAAPPAIAGWIASMGWDVCTTASNHALDQGFQGLVRTKDLYDQAGVRTVGTFRTEAERATPVIVTTAQGVRIAVVTGTYSLNGIPLPSGRPWAVSLLDTADLLAQAKRAKEAGADIVLAEIHGGDEYVVRPSRQQVDLATALTASPYVDLVFGEHTHVVQPITRVNGKWVVYGLGNMIGQHLTEVVRAYEGITARFTFTERPGGGFEVSKAEYLPTYWNHNSSGPVRVVLVTQAIAAGTGDVARYRQALDATRRAVSLWGVTPGLVES